MLLVLFAIFAAISVFVVSTATVSLTARRQILPNHAVVNKRYSYRSEPHADQTTAYPNRLRDNEVTDI